MLTHKIRDKNLPLTRKKLSLIWAHGNFFGYDIERIKLYWIYFKISICKEGGIVKLKFKLNFLTINLTHWEVWSVWFICTVLITRKFTRKEKVYGNHQVRIIFSNGSTGRGVIVSQVSIYKKSICYLF